MDALRLPTLSVPAIRLNGSQHVEDGGNNQYIRDGLVFHLDGLDKGPNDGAWTDLIGGVQFTPNEDVQFHHDSVQYGILNADRAVVFSQETSTIEVCFNRTSGYAAHRLFLPGTLNNADEPIAFGVIGSYFVYSYSSAKFSSVAGVVTSATTGIINVSANHNLTLFNGEVTGNDSLAYLSRTTENAQLILRYAKLHSVRIYNRLLTEEEMRHNQEVDYKRFDFANISKTIWITSENDSIDLTINGVAETYAITPNQPSKIVVDEGKISFAQFPRLDYSIKEIDLSSFEGSRIRYDSLFENCLGLTKVIFPHDVPTSNLYIRGIFCNCRAINNIDISEFNLKPIGNTGRIFENCYSLTNLKFGYNLILDISFSDCPLTHASALSVINGLAEVDTPQTVTFKSTTYETLTEEEIALATSKGWTIVSA